ncbi:MAG TPA: HlyD family efflux transporter periplasmic adaptor subunit [Blastocatellia bacterium]|nr:HlyD family efflux transporter periplasmic adaptor subunit [Blastocatellia bacterium]
MGMDVPRTGAKKKKQLKKILYGAVLIVVIGSVTYGVSRLKPAAPSVDGSTLYKGTVTRGTFVRQVRGLGTLVPEEVRYVPAINAGRVEKRFLQQGAVVKADTVLVELSNPELSQALADAESQFRASGANLNTLKAQVGRQIIDQQSTLFQVRSDYKKAKMQYEVNKELGSKGLKSDLEVKLSEIAASDLENRVKIEEQRLAATSEEVKARLSAEDERVRQLKEAVDLKRRQVESLKVRAGIDGVLQLLQVEVGQQVTIGQNIARVADPSRLKAELRIAETQTRDIAFGQPVQVDTRNGIIPGKVSRIDASAQNGTIGVDVILEGELPKGARSDMSVDGTIELEKLDNVLYVSRPVHGQDNATIGLFKLTPDGKGATRVQVRLGKSSVSSIEILDGLKEGDIVILSDTSQWDNNSEIRLT